MHRQARFLRTCLLSSLFYLVHSSLSLAQSHSECIPSPDWGIFISDYGYADSMLDLRIVNSLDFQGREYLSGEWAHAIGYSKPASTIDPLWLEPEFLNPEWITNSNFSVVTPISQTGTNSSGLPVFMSKIQNADLEITIQSEVVDTTDGIQQGRTAASETNVIDSPQTSGRYLLKQTYTYKNIASEVLSDIKIFQMLHSLHGLTALYDDRIYAGVVTPPGPMNFDADFHFDATVIGYGTSSDTYESPNPCLSSPVSLEEPAEKVFNIDTLTFHTQQMPASVDNGYYGDQASGDNHFFFKPSVGIHLNIEATNLTDNDFFDPGDTDYPGSLPLPATFGETDLGDLWVATAQQHDLANLSPGQSQSFTYLLSLHSETLDFRSIINVPIPAITPLLLFLLFVAITALRYLVPGKKR